MSMGFPGWSGSSGAGIFLRHVQRMPEPTMRPRSTLPDVLPAQRSAMDRLRAEHDADVDRLARGERLRRWLAFGTLLLALSLAAWAGYSLAP